jgi:hypothetical protein
VEGKRNGEPVVFLDAAVIVCPEISDICVLKKGSGLKVKTGAINVSAY